MWGGPVAAAAVPAALSPHTPMKGVVTRENAARFAEWFAGFWWAPVLVVLAYTPASFIMFPRWLITMTAVLAFGPWKGFVYAMTGVILAGVATFAPGRLVNRGTIRRLSGQKMKPVMKFMERRGLVAVALVRLVPAAPLPRVEPPLGPRPAELSHFALRPCPRIPPRPPPAPRP